jgi:SAM-dependent methyltransferase
MNGSALKRSRTEADYDEVPYPSLPVAYTQPTHIAAMLQVFGLKAPGAATARVLELGCASGGNIIPLAVRFPQASFTGIDLSTRQVDDANRRIGALGLTNIKIDHGDLAGASFKREAFDYIICHGVFSWVPESVQHAIWRICGDSLAADGVAAISFNVFPGWHLRRVVRDICLSGVNPKDPPLARVKSARETLAKAAAVSTGASAYATLLREEAKRLAKMPSSYWLGEFLAEHNRPCTFDDFIAGASGAGLGYVCEGEVATALPEYFYPAGASQIRMAAGGDALAVQRLTDYHSGRPFRRALLVRAARAPGTATIDPARLKGLHFAADVKRTDGTAFLDAKRRTIQPHGALATAILTKLAEAYPSTQTLEELLGAQAGDGESERKVLGMLLKMLGAEQATMSTLPLQAGRADAAKPRAWAISRMDAMAQQPWATSRHHQAIRLTPVLRALLPMLDGQTSRSALLTAAAKSLEEQSQLSPEQVLATSLAYAARHGLIDA